MTSSTRTPLISIDTDDPTAIGDAVAEHIAGLPHLPRVLGFGEPMHGEEAFPRIRNGLFAALVERAGFTTVAIESSAWHGRVVDAYVRGEDGSIDGGIDAVMAAGFTHGFGASPANQALVGWMREQNRHRPPAAQLRFAGFDAPMETMEAPSPRPALRALHEYLGTRVATAAELHPWTAIDQLLGADEPWVEPAAAMEPARSIGNDPRVGELRAITDDLRRLLDGEAPRLRHESLDDLEDALLAGRTAAGLLAYHAAMAQDTGDRWTRLAAIRDTMMAENLIALADRGPTLAFAQNQHLRTGLTSVSFGPMTLRWQPAGAHLAMHLGTDYRVVATAFGDATHHDLAAPPPDTVEGALHRDLPPGNHLLSAPVLRALQHGRTARTSTNFRYIPIDETLLGEIDDLLFLRSITPG